MRDVLVALLVITVMGSVGLGLRWGDVRRVFKRPWALVRLLATEHIGMPLVALGLCSALGVGVEGTAALVLCAASPGGPIGPMFALNAKGNVALAVTLVVVMAVVSVVTTPLTLSLFGLAPAAAEGIFLPLARTIGLFQLLPLAIGMGVRGRRPAMAAWLGPRMEKVSKGIIAVLIVGMTVTQWPLLMQLPARTTAGTFLLCVVSLGLGYAAAGGAAGDRRAGALTAGVRNLGLALLVATQVYAGSDSGDATVLAVMVYGLAMMVVSAAASAVFARFAPSVSGEE